MERLWKQSAIEYLVRNQDTKSDEEIAVVLGKTCKDIKKIRLKWRIWRIPAYTGEGSDDPHFLYLRMEQRVKDILERRMDILKRKLSRSEVQRCIKNGSLVKESCEICGTTENLEAHHEDYNKPLEIKWLCSIHHHMLHNGTLNL